MNILNSANKVFNFLKKNKKEILSESDLKCLLFAELIKNKNNSITTEWKIKKDKAIDILVYNNKNLDIKKDGIAIKKFEKLIELKFSFYWNIASIMNGANNDIRKLRKLKNSAKELYVIFLDINRKPLPK